MLSIFCDIAILGSTKRTVTKISSEYFFKNDAFCLIKDVKTGTNVAKQALIQVLKL
jgi:hypothetical protein